MLPGVDDGSKNVQMSLKMLAESGRQGVEALILTPHFYADMDSPESFLARRTEALNTLDNAIVRTGYSFPPFTVGAEVHYYRGMSRSKALDTLCFGRSNYILIEMPFRAWHPQFVDEVEEIADISGLNVIIAHIERYLDQDKRLVKRLLENDSLIKQSNAEFFIERSTRKKAMKLLKKGMIDVLASDSHNLTARVPNLRQAYDIIGEDRDGEALISKLEHNGRIITDSAL